LFGQLGLLVGGGVDRRAVLRTDVTALTHALRRVVRLPEQLEQRLVAHLGRLVYDLYDFGLAGAARAHLVVGGVRRIATGVADGRCVDARRLPELSLST